MKEFDLFKCLKVGLIIATLVTFCGLLSQGSMLDTSRLEALMLDDLQLKNWHYWLIIILIWTSSK